uniref:Uncharacterized protein conserved in bacteria n=1 Tax=Clostridioides difficile TaxID=1496 RepID=A0A381KLQ8_CLODI|nr:Uncharacterized protein conserved in bacteria [Clostridioides difficile]
MTKIIINADDFGYCEAVNYGIISAHNNGIVRSTSMDGKYAWGRTWSRLT